MSTRGSDSRIFVQIPAYRDSELPATLRDLYHKAARPESLNTTVVWQHAADERLPADVTSLQGVRVVNIDALESQGCNWARSIAQEYWDGEPFTLLLDSHHRFVRHWDDVVLEMYRQLRSDGVRRPLLTGYLPAYDPDREPGGRRKRPYQMSPLAREDGILTRLTSYPIPFWTTLSRPLPAEFLSLHFVFTAGAFNEDVRFDPRIYFFGDELVTGLRAFTHGYDMFHPHRIVGWHCYNRASRIPHWDNHPNWGRQHRESLALMRNLFLGLPTTVDLGDERSVADYQDFVLTELVV
ncbi:GlcNAc-transferase family protein [Rhodococcus tukisamuensis]|uniref:Glycosyltransferase (GlcNAc) n=1 Tax=Rhodococcus tukisamuensis TaxID=168276 RepID=A0A1G7DEZ4_9NOCA|nr:GlcNAc-transferase family protein [Rhodococcus tukisamuensis]SDE50097.1 Glycosyltransferase (GlcNAc) [Rhodococcus tukisamuensis]